MLKFLLFLVEVIAAAEVFNIIVICVLSIIAIACAVVFVKSIIKISWSIYKSVYYKSDKFNSIKENISVFVTDCNELNAYIETLKNKYIDNMVYDNTPITLNKNIGNWNFAREHIDSYNNSEHVYDCSLSVFKNAREHPFKYICKYFNIQADEETIEYFENMLNDYSSIEQGIVLLQMKYNDLIESHKEDIPYFIRKYDSKQLEYKLNFRKVNISREYIMSYTFRYISAGGNSGQSCTIEFDVDTISSFIEYIYNKINVTRSAKYQRQLMTPRLREYIKERDNYTCCKCGISIRQEPHLLLEIDHIIPIANGGLTEESNLQTLCWRCNRSKGAKIEY